MHWKARIFFTIILLIMPLAIAAAPKVKILEYGYYEFSNESSRSINPKATTGYVTKGKAKLLKTTSQIPLGKGRLFGFKFHISGLREAANVLPLELIVKHPPMTKPDGTVSTGYSYTMDLKLTKGEITDNTGYQLNEKYEMVEGDWLFEFRLLNKSILQKKFHTYKAP